MGTNREVCARKRCTFNFKNNFLKLSSEITNLVISFLYSLNLKTLTGIKNTSAVSGFVWFFCRRTKKTKVSCQILVIKKFY